MTGARGVRLSTAEILNMWFHRRYQRSTRSANRSSAQIIDRAKKTINDVCAPVEIAD